MKLPGYSYTAVQVVQVVVNMPLTALTNNGSNYFGLHYLQLKLYHQHYYCYHLLKLLIILIMVTILIPPNLLSHFFRMLRKVARLQIMAFTWQLSSPMVYENMFSTQPQLQNHPPEICVEAIF